MTGDVDPGVLWEHAKVRHGEYLRDAAADRLVRHGRSGGPWPRHRLAVAVGDHLIALGLRLRQRHDPHPAPGHLYGRSGP